MNKLAFTLAEVLITLAIIGIIAAITLPSIVIKHRNKVLETQYKKSLSTIYQAILFAKQEIGIEKFAQYCTYYPYNDNSHEYPNSNECYEAFYKNLIKYKKFSPEGNWVTNSEISRVSETLKTFNGKQVLTRNRGWDNPIFYTNLMPDGSFMNIHILEANVFIAIDTNGKKKPNKLGYDIFVFSLDKSNDQLSGEMKGSSNNICSKDDETKNNGYYCSYYALKDECPYDSSKRYFKCLP